MKPHSHLLHNKKALKIGLLLVWLCGFFLISLSFYATTQILPSPPLIKNGFSDPVGPTITIFAAPSPFSGSIGERQALAVRSWLGLSKEINVVLFGQDPSVFSFADSFGPACRVSVEPDIDFTFLGTPFFHSMVARARASTSDISVLIHSETVLLPDFLWTLTHLHKLDHDWLLIASSRNVSDFPFRLEANGKHWLGNNGERINTKKLQDFLSHGQWEHCNDNKMTIAWNNGDIPLHNGVLPPFLYGKGFHTRWLINEALTSDFRLVLDASLTVSSFTVGGGGGPPRARKWENDGNALLGALYGSLYFRETRYSNILKLLKCGGGYLVGNAIANTVYPLGSPKGLSFMDQRVFGFKKYDKVSIFLDKVESLDGKVDCFLRNQLGLSEKLSLLFSLDRLVSERADGNKAVVLAVAGYSYKDMLMSWVCRLNRLRVSNFVVCALDDETYEFCVLQGLPVFRDQLSPSNVSFDDCHFGTDCFQRVTKVKSRVVLQILRMGYSVLMSDVDVYWFKNPLPLLATFGPAVFVTQSDEYKVAGPINMPRRLNSGFYYARSDTPTIVALEMVVRHASLSNLSEQPSFYDTLCGPNGAHRVGDDTCREPATNLTVRFLDRDLFPNGAYRDLWDSNNVSSVCTEKGSYVLHNNWVNGRRRKLERQVAAGLWEYDTSTRMCRHVWQKSDPMSYF